MTDIEKLREALWVDTQNNSTQFEYSEKYNGEHHQEAIDQARRRVIRECRDDTDLRNAFVKGIYAAFECLNAARPQHQRRIGDE